MEILVIGGGVFLGRHFVECALAHGHTLTLFNRGRHGSDLFPDVEHVQGDRDGGLSPLAGRRWDAVVDTCGYVPRVVQASAELLRDAVDQYVFISTISVYGDFNGVVDESAAVGILADPAVEEVTGESYGPLKALCESAVAAQFPGRALLIRPGLIVGPHDPTDRFTYWPARVADGGAVLAPGRPERQVQVIDVRDLAAWTLDLVEQRRYGVFNATGPDYTLTMEQLLEACRDASGSDARWVWLDDATLQNIGAGPWMEIPLWIPEDEAGGLLQVDCGRALAAGLRFRPVIETVRDTLDWHRSRPADHQWAAGMRREREAELLKAATAGDTPSAASPVGGP